MAEGRVVLVGCWCGGDVSTDDVANTGVDFTAQTLNRDPREKGSLNTSKRDGSGCDRPSSESSGSQSTTVLVRLQYCVGPIELLAPILLYDPRSLPL